LLAKKSLVKSKKKCPPQKTKKTPLRETQKGCQKNQPGNSNHTTRVDQKRGPNPPPEKKKKGEGGGKKEKKKTTGKKKNLSGPKKNEGSSSQFTQRKKKIRRSRKKHGSEKSNNGREKNRQAPNCPSQDGTRAPDPTYVRRRNKGSRKA